MSEDNGTFVWRDNGWEEKKKQDVLLKVFIFLIKVLQMRNKMTDFTKF